MGAFAFASATRAAHPKTRGGGSPNPRKKHYQSMKRFNSPKTTHNHMKTHMKTYAISPITTIALVAGSFCFTPSSEAALLFDEGFDYPTGNLYTNSSWTDQGSATAVQGSSLAYGSLQTSGGAANLTGGSLNARLNISDIDFANRETWLSLLIEPSTTAQQNNGLYLRGTGGASNGYVWLFGFPDDSDEYNAKRFLPTPPGGSTSTGNSTPITPQAIRPCWSRNSTSLRARQKV